MTGMYVSENRCQSCGMSAPLTSIDEAWGHTTQDECIRALWGIIKEMREAETKRYSPVEVQR